MRSLHDIRTPVQDSFEAFERLYNSCIASSASATDCLAKVCGNEGKRLRPLLVLLSAGLFGKPDEKAVKIATAMEILHNTSLIHDDIVDNATMRHNHETLNALTGNKIAVLAGDYLFAQVLKICADTGDIAVVQQMAAISQNMSEGELIQQYASRQLIADPDTYYAIVERKTALLMSYCCRMGGSCTGADAEQQQILADFGTAIGTAFQITDDILDYVGSKTGKTIGNDIRERKITLPLLHLLQNSDELERNAIMQRLSADNPSQDDVDFIIGKVTEKGGLDYARQQTTLYLQKARQLLEKLPKTPCNQSLNELSDFIIQRNY